VSAALALRDDDTIEAMVPEERAIAMIENCAAQIEKATTIPMVLRIVRQAEAIAAVTRKIEASKKVQRDASILVIYAETQLGVVTRQIPQGRRGKAAVAVPGQATKGTVLAEHGIHRSRANIAEKLAATPPTVLASALDKAERKTVHGVSVELGYAQPWAPQDRGMRKVAMNAIGLLVTCQSTKRAPTAEEVDPLRDAFGRAGLVTANAAGVIE
jgi:hypothetical protein